MDISNVEFLLMELVQIAKAQYTLGLYCVGVVGAVFVLFLLYKFFKLFY